nr:uncharacterized protein CI109_003573 [Kwoniella shandongensis]KAA5527920.1 hypothetical protein CI109_003573 [Kwoniella shandongensis]
MSNTVSSSSPARRKPIKPQAENWDEDFEFSLPTASNKKKTPSTTSSAKESQKENVDTNTKSSGGKARDVEDWDEEEEEENWDDSPPRPSAKFISVPITSSALAPTAVAGPSRQRQSSKPAPLSIPSNAYTQPPPRLSPSHSSSLPSPSPLPTSRTSTSLTAQQSMLSPRSNSSSALLSPTINEQQKQTLLRSRSGSTSTGTVTRNKLIKRHPSTSFIPIAPNRSTSATFQQNRSESNASLSSIALTNRSSPNLPHPPPGVPVSVPQIPRSTSGEQMPPPPLPGQIHALGRSRSRSKSKTRSGSRQDIRVLNIPFSPSRNDMQEAEEEKQKRPGFWKRFSGAPTSSREVVETTPTQHRRRRSSSVGGKALMESSSPQPPLPPLPPNLRSPSSTSTVSVTSSTRSSGPVSAFSALLRRSSSSLSRRSDKSKDTPPPSSYPYASGSSTHRASTSSINTFGSPVPIPISATTSRNGGGRTPDLPSSSSFSRGFHLPSPSPGSPYHAQVSRMPSTAFPGDGSIPPLPHSSSFPGPRAFDPSDTENEAVDETPKKRKKVRPVSALPAPRMPSGNGWEGDRWKGFNGGSAQIPGLPNQRPPPLNAGLTSPQSSTFASTTSNTLRRLGSLSKKHGRKLSGGWKFGNASSSNINTPKDPAANKPLETVMGSPSKLSRDTSEGTDDLMRNAIRAGSVSAPSSAFKSGPTPSRDDLATIAAVPIAGNAEVNASDMAVATAAKKEKHRRRQSWNDFVIPREVMEKQKGLKEKIGAVKMFAGGIESLKSLLSTHAELREKAYTSGSSSDIALFENLEQEFSQWWEMATVLIEVGSTGKDPSTQASLSDPPRSRRVTLASDEARAASEAMLKASSAPGGPSRRVTPHPAHLTAGSRKSSLPDPEETGLGMSGPPKASPPPDHWRASTGRQDLSKRQLEVLRTMLRTPIDRNTSGSSAGRPSMGLRTASTLSASTTASNQLYASQDPNLTMTRSSSRSVIVARTQTPGEGSPISFPSPSDSAHIVPSPSLPSPTTASLQAQPESTIPAKTLKQRRASKAGLAGLKEFLRSLKSKDRSGGGPLSPTSGGGFTPMRKMRSKSKNGTSTSPPASPIEPSHSFASRMERGYSDEMFYPSSTNPRSSFSALGPVQIPGLPSSTTTSRTTSSQSQISFVANQQIKSPTSPTPSGTHSRSMSRHQSPILDSTSARLKQDTSSSRRPSIRNIFRTSSGNWSELVTNNGNSPSPSSSSNSIVKKKISTPRLPFSPSGFGLGKPITSNASAGSSRVSVSDPIPLPHSVSNATLSSKATASSQFPLSTSSSHLAGFGIPKSDSSRTLTADNNGGEMTLRPGRKSRVSGLGLGLGWPERDVEAMTSISTTTPISPIWSEGEGGEEDHTLHATTSGLVEGQGAYKSRQNSATTTTSSTSTTDLASHDRSPVRHQEEVKKDDLIVALTPENLPTLLEYLRQCEMKLGQWRGKVGELALASGQQV